MIGATFVSFHSSGTCRVFSDLLNNIDRGVASSFLASSKSCYLEFEWVVTSEGKFTEVVSF